MSDVMSEERNLSTFKAMQLLSLSDLSDIIHENKLAAADVTE